MDLEKQVLILSALASSRDLLALCSGIIKPNYFDPSLRKGAKFVTEYFNKFKSVPNPEIIRVECSGLALDKFPPFSKDEIKFISGEIEEFCRNRAMVEAIKAGPELIQKGDFNKILEEFKSAVTIGLAKDLGVDYFSSPADRLRLALEREQLISTGILELDLALGGGVARQELLLFAAESGGGKSMTMLNVGKNFLAQGLNGVYFSLEMKESRVASRLDSMITGMSPDEILKDIDMASMVIEKNSLGYGKLIIKRFPENRTNVNHFRSYLQQLQQQTGFVPDFIIVDYVDITGTTMNIEVSNLFIKDKFVTEEIRALGLDYDCIVLSASQLGRCVSVNSVIELQDGTKKPIKDVQVGELIKTDTGFNKVLNKTTPKLQKVFLVKTKSGKILKMSKEHIVPIFDKNGKELGETNIKRGLCEGMCVKVKNA